ncbi:hypothetical protein QOZ88_02975 [Blastococcus sp. BMG 814]|uniref:TIGR02678 family protein n=1 Tax=Blastococcus carthaginiensis TaxID=3050034 RepID=A0ABT9I7R0_9ACTN|nr:hypothetical protein [Blastococcus carthaginiensis]MDP5181588.1 hypothetical protein [Blastococcus carthaginiensis]
MPNVSSLQKYFPLDEDCEAALLLLQLTVASALRDAPPDEIDGVIRDHQDLFDRLGPHITGSAYVESLRNRSSLWRNNLLAWVGDQPEMKPCGDQVHRLVVLLEVCTSSVFVDCERLQAAAAVRRTDFLLDLLEVDGWCGDVRLRYVEAVQILVGQLRKGWLPKAASRARKVADLFSHVDPNMGLAAAVLGWVDDEPKVAVPVSPTPVLARVLGVCLLALPEQREGLASAAVNVLLRDIDRMSRRVEALQRGAAPMYAPRALAELQGLQCSQARGLEFLGSLAPRGLVLDGDHVPTLVGHRVPDARAVLARVSGDLGVEVVAASGGKGVPAWFESSWHVVGQERLDEGVVRLLVSKTEA